MDDPVVKAQLFDKINQFGQFLRFIDELGIDLSDPAKLALLYTTGRAVYDAKDTRARVLAALAFVDALANVTTSQVDDRIADVARKAIAESGLLDLLLGAVETNHSEDLYGANLFGFDLDRVLQLLELLRVILSAFGKTS